MTIYLDHNATTPLRPEVWEAMAAIDHGLDLHANPSSTHRAGLRSAKVVRDAREGLANAIGAHPDEVLFTGGGSEAINLALKGFYWASDGQRSHIVTTAVEHHAVLHAVEWLTRHGAVSTVLPVDLRCRVNPEAVAEALRPDTLMVSAMYVNNEVGSIQPVGEIGAICRERGVPLHIDAVQAAGKLPIDVDDLGCDLLTLSAHKVGGPKGVGLLYVRRGTRIEPLVHGGKQEHGLRAGTQNVAGIAGFAAAMGLAEREREANWAHATELRAVLRRLPRELNAVRVNGDPDHTVPHCVSATVLFCDGMALSANLSARGVCVSTGSACTSGDLEPSHVLRAMGLSDQAAFCTLRFSTGPSTTTEQAHTAVDATKELAEIIREVTMPEDIGRCTEDCPCFLTA